MKVKCFTTLAYFWEGFLSRGLTFEGAYFNSAELLLRVYYRDRAYNKVFTVFGNVDKKQLHRYCLKSIRRFNILGHSWLTFLSLNNATIFDSKLISLIGLKNSHIIEVTFDKFCFFSTLLKEIHESLSSPSLTYFQVQLF